MCLTAPVKGFLILWLCKSVRNVLCRAGRLRKVVLCKGWDGGFLIDVIVRLVRLFKLNRVNGFVL